ncbi:hypothetical protein ANN_07617 [Periplaneta americana]|uniref:Uncharacterized protein n=1 Tax=Periplaneta americana TaxID=6978 RepID=A0ABQ8SZR9_PERAM|nr:hypothetical protein ANN_07617 [Periplaneta americana]
MSPGSNTESYPAFAHMRENPGKKPQPALICGRSKTLGYSRINETYPGRWIGRGGVISWPPRSPDLTPLDYYVVWGWFKSEIYKRQVETREERFSRVLHAFAQIKERSSQYFRGLRLRLDKISLICGRSKTLGYSRINETYPGRWIGRGGVISWPPRSPDLTPLDYYVVWGWFKSEIYKRQVETREERFSRVLHAFAQIKERSSQYFRGLRLRLDKISLICGRSKTLGYSRINETYPGRWIGRGGVISWPPRSPDLTPLDYYVVWGWFKSEIYKRQVETREERFSRVLHAFAQIKERSSQYFRGLRLRLDKISLICGRSKTLGYSRINETYPGRWIGRGGVISWPPRSPDLTPLDYYVVWGWFKSEIYKRQVETREERFSRVLHAFAQIKERSSQYFRGLRLRLDKICQMLKKV